ncbi:hypothetical protein [Coprobacter fastidiosus]|uniref:DUF4145 domain-containing protein n=1 Tax=Coprobacter fastidiosus NSB1 = JCM 33896 TaxID=1349822 RepID=A0A495WK94_9BACT|nr:hypothetical protein [Coprobacter fastidiosus]ERM89068.1 hypothetical protein NSB1T_11805 [Coprobacter fastidiosus NSB1 = JCM 33896]RKT61514.1 hypothetical protein BC742_0566 [Coprobacter fastidiosus NSB1 = JCM 33896]BEG61583.1 hypothetical protein Cfast33896_05380 [Coprobacter fastidiosus]
MEKKLDDFISNLEGFENFSLSEQIDTFAYFILINQKYDGFIAKEIALCFHLLRLKPHTNIPYYLSSNSKDKNSKFIKQNGKYYIQRTFKQKLDERFGSPVLPAKVTSEFFPIDLLLNTRGYLVNVANQALASYNKGIYDGCSVLTRKLIEILIIECFEKHSIENRIKKSDGSFYFLSDLITELLKDPKWNITRNAKQAFPKIKKIGDMSAHNRRYVALKADLDSIKDDIRIVIGELIHLIDYPNWK